MSPRTVAIAISVCIGLVQPMPAKAADFQCPHGYWLLHDLCLDDVTGDIEIARSAPSSSSVGSGCPKGYWRLNALCFDLATGDVELADATPASSRQVQSPSR